MNKDFEDWARDRIAQGKTPTLQEAQEQFPGLDPRRFHIAVKTISLLVEIVEDEKVGATLQKHGGSKE